MRSKRPELKKDLTEKQLTDLTAFMNTLTGEVPAELKK